jgi:chromosome segregation ATPase
MTMSELRVLNAIKEIRCNCSDAVAGHLKTIEEFIASKDSAIANLEEINAALSADLTDEVQAILMKQELEIVALEDENHVLQESIAVLQQSNSVLQKLNAELENENTALENTNSSICSELTVSKAKVAELECVSDEMTEANVVLVDDYYKMTNDIAVKDDEIASLTNEVARKDSDVNSLTAQLTSSEAKCAKCVADGRSMQSKLDKLTATSEKEITTLKRTNSVQAASLKMITAEHAAVKTPTTVEHATLKEHVVRLKEIYRKSMDQLKMESAKVKQLEENLVAVKNESSQMLARMTKMDLLSIDSPSDEMYVVAGLHSPFRE